MSAILALGQQVTGNDAAKLTEVHGTYGGPAGEPGLHYVDSDGTRHVARWVIANPDLSGMYGHSFPDGPFAVYARWQGRPEYRTRNHSATSALRAARRMAGEGARVHVSLDTCG